MILFKKTADLKKFLATKRAAGLRLGWVPTMGALHQGHLSLIESSKKDNAISICSIFVNPTQFNVSSDFEKYPISIEKDILLLDGIGTDLLFLPDIEEIYADG